MTLYKSQKRLNINIREFYLTAGLVVTVICLGTLGYCVFEGWDVFDAFYMTIITLSTVGYSEAHPLSHSGRVFTIVLILTGVGVAYYSFTVIARMILQGEFKRYRELSRMQKKIGNFRRHTIVCGYGRLAHIVVRELMEGGHHVVVIEHDPDAIKELELLGVPFVEGSAYEDNTLVAAGIEHAKNLLSLLPQDSDNVYVTLCARDLNKNLEIVARAESESGENKILRAGANKIVAPYRVSANRVVQQLIRPYVSDFLEIAAGKTATQLVLEEVEVPKDSPLGGKTFEETDVRNKTGAFIAAVIDQNGKMLFNPGRESTITPGSTMIVLGDQNSVDRLSRLLCDVGDTVRA